LLLRGGETVPLTPKCFEILNALVESGGEVVSKESLIERVWPDSFVEEGNLTYNISMLRKALGERAGDNGYIQTVPCQGYRFTADVVEACDRPVEAEVAEDATTRPAQGGAPKRIAIIAAVLIVFCGLLYWITTQPKTMTQRPSTAAVKSIAVLPFELAGTENSDAEYLSDGISESLINRLAQLPGVKVIARSSSFKYKGKDPDPQDVAKLLGVEMILAGRVAQRGDELHISVELINAHDKTQIWGGQYNRKLTGLLTLQTEIARDVSQKLRGRLSRADEQKLAKYYTESAEASELYMRGRYHVLKATRSEMQTAISYFQQAIDIDPGYAPAYVGVADALRGLSLAGEMASTEVFPKAKAAAQKALELDDSLAEAHAILGIIIFWYDWDWDAAENQFKRALEIDSNSADTHQFYANLLSFTGRHGEALDEIKRARELDPLNLRINALESQFLLHAGRTDEALAKSQKTFELDANYFLPHMWAASAYIEKGMYAEAVAEARKAREFSGASTHPAALLGYALSKSGKRAEARVVLDELLKISAERYVSPYSIALLYNGLDRRVEALGWLERGVAQRDARMVFLKVEPKWNNLRDDPRFQDLLRRINFTP
jgi:TolB-like protein/DNA-binding winged helix-turn-helix (wHTH) protein/Tfp pilus assembly protein PilF